MGVVSLKPTICQDTREHNGKKDHILKVFDKLGYKVVRSKMFAGDWTLLTNQSVCIDTKSCGLPEVYTNLIQKHETFANECDRAREAGIRLIVLIEDPKIKTLEEVQNWVNPRSIIYQKQVEQGKATQKAPPISSKRLYNIMRTMSENHGVEWAFTTREKCGETILALLGVTCDDNT